MMVTEQISDKESTAENGIFPACVGLASSVLPETRSVVAIESSQTGVSTKNALLATKPKAQREADIPHWYAQ